MKSLVTRIAVYPLLFVTIYVVLSFTIYVMLFAS